MFYFFLSKYFIYLMLFSGFVVFCSMRKHFLMTLLSLEYLVLCVYMIMIYFIYMNYGDLYVIMIFLIFSVCEGALGLSILVTVVRSHGNDYVNSIFILGW